LNIPQRQKRFDVNYEIDGAELVKVEM